MNKNKNIIYRTLMIIVILVIINLLSNFFSFRLDFTADNRFTLNRATKRILHEIKQSVIITLYISDDLPPDINRTVKTFKNLLVEYNNFSSRKIEIEAINPNKNEELEQQAIEAGIRPIPLETRGKDQLKVQKVYLGAVIQVGDNSEVIPLIKPGIAMEYMLSSIIKKLSIHKKPEIGYIQGHGEPLLAELSQTVGELSMFYKIKNFNLTAELDLNKYKSLVIIAPTKTFKQAELDKLDQYLSVGGNIFIALDRVQGLLQQGVGVGINTGLEKWLEKKGLFVDEAFIIDKKCGSITLHQKQGFFTYDQQINFPYLPVISNFASHSITDGIETVVLQFASPISYVGNSIVNYYPLAWTSKISGKYKAPISFEIGKQWKPQDFLHPELTVAALLEGKLASEKSSKLCVIGDGNFMVNGIGENAIQIQQDNINFIVNAVDWLSDDSGLMSLRTKGISSRPLTELDDSKIFLLKYLNFLFPVIAIIFYGLFRFKRRKIKRGRRMKKGYIT